MALSAAGAVPESVVSPPVGWLEDSLVVWDCSPTPEVAFVPSVEDFWSELKFWEELSVDDEVEDSPCEAFSCEPVLDA